MRVDGMTIHRILAKKARERRLHIMAEKVAVLIGQEKAKSPTKPNAYLAGSVVRVDPREAELMVEKGSAEYYEQDQQPAVQADEATTEKAKKLGVDISRVKGTGPNGRVTVQDVEAVKYGAQEQAQPKTKAKKAEAPQQ